MTQTPPLHFPTVCGNTELCPGCKEQERRDELERMQSDLLAAEQEERELRLAFERKQLEARALREALQRVKRAESVPVEAYTDADLRAAITTDVWSGLEMMDEGELREALADYLIPADETPRAELLEDILDRARGAQGLGEEDDPDLAEWLGEVYEGDPEGLEAWREVESARTRLFYAILGFEDGRQTPTIIDGDWCEWPRPTATGNPDTDRCATCLTEQPLAALTGVFDSGDQFAGPIRVCRDSTGCAQRQLSAG